MAQYPRAFRINYLRYLGSRQPNRQCYSRAITKERMAQSTEEAMAAEATRSVNDPQNGSNPTDFISIFWQNQNLFLPCCFIVAFIAGMRLGTTQFFFTREETQQRTRQRQQRLPHHRSYLDTYPYAGGG